MNAANNWTRRFRPHLYSIVFVAAIVLLPAQIPAQDSDTETITIDPAAAAHPFPHFWERMFGSGRAILSLRDDYRRASTRSSMTKSESTTRIRRATFSGISATLTRFTMACARMAFAPSSN
jgi:hypothetical protein